MQDCAWNQMVFLTNRLRFLECCLSAVIYFSHISKPVAKNTQNKKKHARKSFKWLIIMLTVPRFPSGNLGGIFRPSSYSLYFRFVESWAWPVFRLILWLLWRLGAQLQREILCRGWTDLYENTTLHGGFITLIHRDIWINPN